MPYIIIFLLCAALQLHGHDLVEVKRHQPKIVIDFRYATADNFFGRALYPFSTIYLERYVAHRLGRVMRDLAKDGVGLIIYEGYRPPSVQGLIEAENCAYKDDAPHYRKGLGVDVALYYLDGQSLELPTAYDARSPRAYRDYYQLPPHVFHNSSLLEQVMCRHGFVPMREKWWHFDLHGWEEAPDLTLEYEDLITHPAPKWE